MTTKRALVVCENGIIAAWHPKEPFLYANSRPIDLRSVDEERQKLFGARPTDEGSPRLFRSDGPSRLDLREIFYTAKYSFTPVYRETKLYQLCAPLGKRKP